MIIKAINLICHVFQFWWHASQPLKATGVTTFVAHGTWSKIIKYCLETTAGIKNTSIL